MARAKLRVRVITTATAAAAVLTVAVGVSLALDHQHGHDDRPHLDTTTGLLVTTRSDLRMCVETGTGATQANIRSAIMAAIERAERHPHWRSAYSRSGTRKAVVLDFGCPAPRLPPQYEPRATVAGPGLTDNPSPYRVWIYVLDEQTADRFLGAGKTTAVAPAELMSESTTLFPVSTALIIRAGSLGDATATTHGLQAALGLEPNR